MMRAPTSPFRLLGVLALGTLAALAACAERGVAAADRLDEWVPEAELYGGTVVVGIMSDFTDVNPLTRQTAVAGDLIQHVLQLPLVGYDERQLRRLVELYAGRMAGPAARRQLDRIERAGLERLHFAWAGALRPGEPHYYRIHGPTVLVEYDNSQSDADHIHTVWRDLENDFGGDLLRQHYARHPRPHRH